jgi:ribosomal protein S18 acetylase RimI-like enzyme
MSYFVFPRSLRDHNLRLRPLRIRDGRFIAAGLADAAILRACGMSDAPAASWVSLVWWMRRTYPLAFCIELDGRRIGFLGLYRLHPGKSASLSLAIFDETCRNRGYGTRALTVIVKYVRKCRLARCLDVDVMQGNPGALNFWNKAGFSEASASGGVLTLTRDLEQD